VAAIAGLPGPAPAGTNLLTNASFETSVLPAAVADATYQPVLPTGWAFEGASELFDHATQSGLPGSLPRFPGAKAGKYWVQISGSWSGSRRDCTLNSAAGAMCLDVPGGAQKDELYKYYSLAPAWRPLMPIAVTGGSYTISAWMAYDIPFDGTGAVVKVRWLDANGVPISVSAGPSLIAPTPSSNPRANYYTFAERSAGGAGGIPANTYAAYQKNWTYGKVTVTAPANAVQAVPLFGYSDSAWIGGVMFDVVCFSRVSTGDVC
jgi:hypothetical protein